MGRRLVMKESDSPTLYVVAVVVAVAVSWLISSNLRRGARDAPTETEWQGVKTDIASLGVVLAHVSEHRSPVTIRISGKFATAEPKDVAVAGIVRKFSNVGWKDYEPLHRAHGRVISRICRDGIVGSISAQSGNGGLNDVFIHVKWSAGSQRSLPQHCVKVKR
mgnify:CR=1 FL=1